MSSELGSCVLYRVQREGKADLSVQDLHVPTPDEVGEGEVLVRMKGATICNSDLHTIQGRRQEPTPAVLGHEGYGSILVSKRQGYKIGELVTFSITDTCGECRQCQLGPQQKCKKLFKYGHYQHVNKPHGCYSSHLVVKSGTKLVQIPPGLDADVFTPINCALATMVAARRVAKQVLQERGNGGRCLIYGAGLLGIYGIGLLKEMNMDVFITDLSKERMLIAESFGGLAASTDGNKDGYDLIVEACGVGAIVEQAVPLLRPGGVLVLVGGVIPDSKFSITAESLIRKCATIIGVHNYQHYDLQEAVEYTIRTRDIYDYKSLLSPPFPIHQFESAVALAEKGTYHRVLIKP